MDNKVQSYFDHLGAKDKKLQYEAHTNILALTNEEVGWAYEVWDELKEWLTDSDPHKRSRAAQFLANLAISDGEKRILKDFPTLWKVTRDEKFVTARHALQAVWRVGLAGSEQKKLVITHFIDRFHTCENEKNYTLIRFDIIQGLKNLYEKVEDEEIKREAIKLIEREEDNKYRKKYMNVWK
jgi:hypothetical protein